MNLANSLALSTETEYFQQLQLHVQGEGRLQQISYHPQGHLGCYSSMN